MKASPIPRPVQEKRCTFLKANRRFQWVECSFLQLLQLWSLWAPRSLYRSITLSLSAFPRRSPFDRRLCGAKLDRASLSSPDRIDRGVSRILFIKITVPHVTKKHKPFAVANPFFSAKGVVASRLRRRRGQQISPAGRDDQILIPSSGPVAFRASFSPRWLVMSLRAG